MKRVLALILVTACLLLPGISQAFDGERRGFVLGFGAGYGSAKQSLGVSGVSLSVSTGGPATTFKIGGGITDQFLLYYSNRAVFFSRSSVNFVQGMSTVAGSYFLKPEGPSPYFTGELGLGILTSSQSGASSSSGFGIGIGAGYEFAKHWAVEATFEHAGVGSEKSEGVSVDESISDILFQVTWLGY